MSRFAIYACLVGAIFLFGFGVGWHAKTVKDNSAIVKQVVKVAKIDAQNEAKVEKQDDSDKVKIKQLENDLNAIRRDAAIRWVPKPSNASCLPSAEADARIGESTGSRSEPVDSYEEAYRTFRDELLVAGAEAEQLRLQVLSCQAQWPQ